MKFILSEKGFDNFSWSAKTFTKFFHLSEKGFDNFSWSAKTFTKFFHLTLW